MTSARSEAGGLLLLSNSERGALGTSEAQDTFAIDERSVSKSFGSGERSVLAVDDVSLAIRENEFLTLLGPSGCGKTTLLRMIAGFDHPTHGQILLDGSDISGLPPFQRPVNTVFQNYALFPHMTVAQNIGFGLEMQGKSANEVGTTVGRMLDLVQMSELKDRRTDQISGGQQQRVALARALAPHPKVLLLDEPLSALDYKLRKEMQMELKRLQHETGITFVFVTHDQEEALTMSDRIAVMRAGKVLQLGSPRNIYDHPAERFVADFIGDTNFLHAEILAQEGRSATLRLNSGCEIAADLPEEFSPSIGNQVTAVVRPEHASLASMDSEFDLSGILSNIVYVGTDTHYYVDIGTGESFVARLQNTRDGGQIGTIGSTVGVRFQRNAIQVLKD
jgi:spermidine/putrescine transport system ATP-binding protein